MFKIVYFYVLYYHPQEKVKEFGILKENMFAFWDVSILCLQFVRLKFLLCIDSDCFIQIILASLINLFACFLGSLLENNVVIFINFGSGLEADILFGLPLGCLLLSILVRNYLNRNIMGVFYV